MTRTDKRRAAEIGKAIKAEYDAVCQSHGLVGWQQLSTHRRADRTARVRANRLARTATDRKATTMTTTTEYDVQQGEQPGVA